MVWLIRAIINGNIIIQASISKRSHLNEYIFCLGAVTASEPLKEKKEKKSGEGSGAKPGRMGRKNSALGNERLTPWAKLQVWPWLTRWPWARPHLPPAQPGEPITRDLWALPPWVWILQLILRWSFSIYYFCNFIGTTNVLNAFSFSNKKIKSSETGQAASNGNRFTYCG